MSLYELSIAQTGVKSPLSIQLALWIEAGMYSTASCLVPSLWHYFEHHGVFRRWDLVRTGHWKWGFESCVHHGSGLVSLLAIYCHVKQTLPCAPIAVSRAHAALLPHHLSLKNPL